MRKKFLKVGEELFGGGIYKSRKFVSHTEGLLIPLPGFSLIWICNPDWVMEARWRSGLPVSPPVSLSASYRLVDLLDYWNGFE